VQIEQLLANLILNGMEATESIQRGARKVTVTTGRSRKGEIEIGIWDSGPGIPAEIRERLFTPFFTTKPRGLGMGLAICRSIVERHGGRMWAEDGDGSGATLRVSEVPPGRRRRPRGQAGRGERAFTNAQIDEGSE
jgi:signal transduction histidine kinase